MTEIQTHHSTTFHHRAGSRGITQGFIHTGNTFKRGDNERFVKVDDDEIYTGEFVDKTPYDIDGNPSQNPMIEFLKRKSKDHYVFLKDYKPKITEIITRLGRLEFHFGYFRKNKRKEDKEWRRRIGQREKLLTERIEKLEKKIYNLENPPLKPVLKNPFD